MAAPPRLGATLANRQQGQPEHILAIGNRAQQRLHKIYRQMRARGKPHNVTVVACARELSCFPCVAATANSPAADSLTGREAGAPGHQLRALAGTAFRSASPTQLVRSDDVRP